MTYTLVCCGIQTYNCIYKDEVGFCRKVTPCDSKIIEEIEELEK